MTDLGNSVVHAGWLTKSPTGKHPWKAKWRERWFVLRQSDHIPGQYLLEYYSNEECKKLKGCINLDECEQVDAGLALKSHSGNKSQKYVFDIKTSQKTFFLATRSEEDMNKWVQSICSVCGLKLREATEDPAALTNDYRYSPVPNGSRLAFGNGPLAPTASNTGDNNNGRYLEGQFKSQVVSKQPTNSVAIHHQKEASTSSSESSGPYIPISECHSGNPTDVRANESRTPTTKDTLKPSANSNSSVNKNVILADELYDFPRANTSNVTLKVDESLSPSAHGTCDESSNNNWPNFTSSKDDIIRASVRSCSALLDSCKSNSTLTRDSRNSQSFHSASRLRGASTGGTASGEESIVQGHSKKDCDNDFAGMSGSEVTLLTGKVPPPRPPKPATLRRSKSKSQSSSSLVNNNDVLEDVQLHQSVPPPPPPVVTVSQVDESYDIPKSTVNKDTVSNVTQVVPTPMSTVYVRGKKGPLNQVSPLAAANTSVRPPELTTSELYDFPKSVEANATISTTTSTTGTTATSSKNEPVFDLNATVPFVGQMKKDSGGRHSYSNAAPGFKSNKESVFNYDYKPTLPSTSDDQIALSPFGDSSSNAATVDKSPRTPNSVFSPSSDVTPPAVDRKLKPRRKGSDSDATASPTAPHPFPLSPPPAVCRKSNFSTSTLPSSKSLKNKNGQHSYDSIPRLSNTLGHRSSSTGCHSRDPSISEDDCHVIGRSDEVKVKLPRKQRQIPENPELQYLDLDLIDSDHSSPRTPTSVPIEPSNSSSASNIKHTVTTHKERSPGGINVAATITPSLAKSTVYKTVDFIKTEALNKLRHTLDQGNT